jgi:hypothetical protein
MKLEKLYHKCGYSILEVKIPVGPVTESHLVDGEKPYVVGKNGQKKLNIIKTCPDCGATLRRDRLYTEKPYVVELKGPTGYIPVTR